MIRPCMGDETTPAIIGEGDSSHQRDVSVYLNTALGASIAIALVFLVLSRVIGAPLEDQIADESEGYTPIWERYLEDYVTDGENSYILENGTLT